jgi:hypothetical protein
MISRIGCPVISNGFTPSLAMAVPVPAALIRAVRIRALLVKGVNLIEGG